MADGARPKLHIPRTRTEIALEVVGLAAMAALVVFALRAWSTLPQSVPVHFGVNGQVDAWGGRDSLLALLGLSVAFYAGLSVLERFPHVYNYPVPVTTANAARLYVLGRQLIVAVKVILSASFAALFAAVVLISRGQLATLTGWYLPTIVVSLGIVLAFTIVKMTRAGRTA
jgi:hypothetical protein